jgi:hypothetical protein
MTMRLVTLLALLLLAGPVDPRTESTSPPPPSDVHVNRHIDAHVPARESDQAPDVSDTRSDTRSDPRAGGIAPDPAPGTGVFQSGPLPAPIRDPRDPLSRDRRF